MGHKGIKELKKYLNGGSLTRSQAMTAMCADCMGQYIDGRMDCEILKCPLYPWMAYAPKRLSLLVEHRKTITTEQKERMRQGRIRAKAD